MKKTWHYIISEKCNFKCTYCNVDVNNPTKLSNEDFDNFYKENIELIDEEYQFDIFGGEPFLTIDEIEYIIKYLEIDNNCRVIGITTNGSIYNDRVAKIVSHPKVICTVSHDGINQERNRGTSHIFVDELKAAGAKLGHSMLIGDDFNSINYNPIMANHKELSRIGLLPDLTLVRDIGCWNKDQVEIFKYHYKSYINYIISLIKNNTYNEFIEIPLLVRKYLAALLESVINSNNKTDCGCGTNYITVTPDKRLSPCERFLRDDSTINKMNNKWEVLDKCLKCDIYNYCDKGCIYEQLKNEGPIQELCDIYHIIFIEIQRLISSTEKKTIQLFKK